MRRTVQGSRAFGLTDHCRDAEVHDARGAVGADHDIGRLDVAVYHLLAVRVDEAVGDLDRYACRARLVEPPVPPQQLRDRHALDVLEHQVMTAVMFYRVVEGNDIGVVELADDARFLQQKADFFRGGAGADRLECDLAPQMRVVREVHAALRALAQRARDLEAAYRIGQQCLHGARRLACH